MLIVRFDCLNKEIFLLINLKKEICITKLMFVCMHFTKYLCYKRMIVIIFGIIL